MKETVLEKLQELNIAYKVVEHTPVYTIEEMDNLGNIFEGAKICKNLFVRDQKGKRHFLIVVPEEKRVPLAEVTEKIGSTKVIPLAIRKEKLDEVKALVSNKIINIL